MSLDIVGKGCMPMMIMVMLSFGTRSGGHLQRMISPAVWVRQDRGELRSVPAWSHDSQSGACQHTLTCGVGGAARHLSAQGRTS